MLCEIRNGEIHLQNSYGDEVKLVVTEDPDWYKLVLDHPNYSRTIVDADSNTIIAVDPSGGPYISRNYSCFDENTVFTVVDIKVEKASVLCKINTKTRPVYSDIMMYIHDYVECINKEPYPRLNSEEIEQLKLLAKGSIIKAISSVQDLFIHLSKSFQRNVPPEVFF